MNREKIASETVLASHLNEWYYVGRVGTVVAWAGRTTPQLDQVVLRDMVTPGTWSYGETVFVRPNANGCYPGRYDIRVAMPQNYAAAYGFIYAAIRSGWNLDTVVPGIILNEKTRKGWSTQRATDSSRGP